MSKKRDRDPRTDDRPDLAEPTDTAAMRAYAMRTLDHQASLMLSDAVDEIERLRILLAAAPSPWTPVESAPWSRTGSCLVANKARQVAPMVNGVIHNNVGSFNDWDYGSEITYCMPLAAAPEPPNDHCELPHMDQPNLPEFSTNDAEQHTNHFLSRTGRAGRSPEKRHANKRAD